MIEVLEKYRGDKGDKFAKSLVFDDSALNRFDSVMSYFLPSSAGYKSAVVEENQSRKVTSDKNKKNEEKSRERAADAKKLSAHKDLSEDPTDRKSVGKAIEYAKNEGVEDKELKRLDDISKNIKDLIDIEKEEAKWEKGEGAEERKKELKHKSEWNMVQKMVKDDNFKNYQHDPIAQQKLLII